MIAVTAMDEVRAYALSLPEAASQEHHGMESFRVRDKIFATVPDEQHIRIMVTEDGIRAAAAEHPEACSPFFWGVRLACVVVAVEAADQGLVRELLVDAWRRKAPKRLAATWPGA